MEMELTCIEFDQNEIPVSKKVDIDGSLFTFELQYNEMADFYTILVYDNENNPLITSKLTYMGNVFHANTPGIPDRKLIPLSITDLASAYPPEIKVNKETFGDTVKLYLI